ncbi:MAG: type II and III secretion system protein [Bacteroidales bacterium]|nr:type II and III secretion system protein [Bacteroidales bacterium]
MKRINQNTGLTTDSSFRGAFSCRGSIYKVLLSFLIFISVASVRSQHIHIPDSLESRLNVLAADVPGLYQEVELSVTGMELHEFIRNLANTNNLNIHVSPDVNDIVSNTFNQVAAKDVLLFLIEEYNLDVSITGRIITLKKMPVVEPEFNNSIKYNAEQQLLTLDIDGQYLDQLCKQITQSSGVNLVATPAVRMQKVKAYIQNKPVHVALEQLALANNLGFYSNEDFFVFEESVPKQANSANRRNGKKKVTGSYTIEAKSIDDITVLAEEATVEDIVVLVSEKLDLNYYLIDNIDLKKTIKLRNASLEELLEYLFTDSKFNWYIESGVYMFGSNTQSILKETRLIQLQNRAIDSLLGIFPKNIKGGLEIGTFHELNSYVVTGSPAGIDHFEKFVKQIDKVVPLILIEIVIVELNESKELSTTLNAGLAESYVPTTGTVLPLDMTLSSSSVNSIINGINGWGLINLGHVTPNFFVTLRALEKEGYIDIKDTPRLSTLNGHEAELTVGKEEYYVEESYHLFANQTTTQQGSKMYKPANADFKVVIRPIVSGNEYITLDILVDQTDFTGQKLDKNAPPNKVSRNFKSLIRVRNEEMILLGGLESEKINNTSEGLPLLSRIPIIKWFFSGRTKSKSKSKLNIFIKPTVIY